MFVLMPELPEVETVMRGMRAALEGQTIVDAIVRRPDLRWPLPPRLTETLKNRKIEGFRRRGKYIFMRLSGGVSMLLHLGMSGRVVLGPLPSGEARRHEHLVFSTASGTHFGLIDPRRFGAVDLISTAEEDRHTLLASMGPEPLEATFTADYLARALAGRRAPIKTMLLDQRIVAGLGNIYVCEALFRARIHPEAPAGLLVLPDLRRLVRATRAVLKDAIAAGGSSLRDYVQPDGELGYFQHAWRVYGREGEGCPDCPGERASGKRGRKEGCGGVRRLVQGGRSTFFCPRLQVLPPQEAGQSLR